MKNLNRHKFLCGFVGLMLLSVSAFGEATENFQALQLRLNETLLDVYAGSTVAPENSPLKLLETLRPALQSDAARRLVETAARSATTASTAAQIGTARGVLQQVAALEMLQQQSAGNIAEAREWRSVIALPKYANAVDGALLLQQPIERARQPEISQVLAREDLTWQVMRTRQVLDYLQEGAAQGEATDAFIDATTAEALALSNFPPELLQSAGLPTVATKLPAHPQASAPYQSAASRAALADWRSNVEATLPNLLKPEDVTRLGRLLVRFVKLVPREYRNGVADGKITIPLEFREARQFTEQAQGLTNELAPTWRRDHPEAFAQFYKPLHEQLKAMSLRIHRLQPVEQVEESSTKAVGLLEDKFDLSARTAGARGDVIEETAVEVRTALIDSLAAAKADQWEQAESLRLDAYTSFDSEIEIRVLPRNPELGRRTERSFLDGSTGELGIKALLDRRAPIEELTAGDERTLAALDQSVGLLRVSVSPTTISFTTFSIVAREGLEAVIILAALLAGLRGTQNRGTRRWISSGAWLALVASGLTFWLSKTLHPIARPLRRKAGGRRLDSRRDYSAHGNELGFPQVLLGRLELEAAFTLKGFTAGDALGMARAHRRRFSHGLSRGF